MADVGLGNECNNCCVMCTSVMPPPRPWGLTCAQVLEHLEGLERVDNVVLTGGEPTLRADLDEVVRAVRQRFPSAPLLLLTNGRRFSYPGYARRLAAAGLDHAHVSLCGPDASVHDAVTRAPGSFAQTLAGIRNLIAAGVRTEVRYVLHRLTYEGAPDVPGMLAQEAPGVRGIIMMYMDLIGNAFRNRRRLIVPYGEVAPHLARAAEAAAASGLPLELWHVPPCTLPPPVRSFCSGVTVEGRRIEFPPQCALCLDRPQCCGVWRTYAKDVGTAEFEPITS